MKILPRRVEAVFGHHIKPNGLRIRCHSSLYVCKSRQMSTFGSVVSVSSLLLCSLVMSMHACGREWRPHYRTTQLNINHHRWKKQLFLDYSDKTAVNIRPNIKNKDTVWHHSKCTRVEFACFPRRSCFKVLDWLQVNSSQRSITHLKRCYKYKCSHVKLWITQLAI